MEKKPTTTYSGISKSVLKTLNKNYLSEPLKDENRISEIMSEFITGELDTINSRLESNDILNFKDQTNQTLIHAILRNESPNISEENKLGIIQKLVSDKNVSLHTMTNYNQNPLHLACQKGYSLIIRYMFDKGCDQTLIDNYGNAPVHYLIDKFVRDCKDDEFYSQSNQQVKIVNSPELKKINNILKNESILILYKLLGKTKIDSNEYYCQEVGSSGYKIIEAIKKFTANKVKSSLPIIYELINKKIEEIYIIFTNFNESNEIKFEKAKKIIFGIQNDIFQIYGLDMDFKNIVWNNFFSEQKLRIKNKKDDLMIKIIKNVENINSLIELNIINKIKGEFIDKIYNNLLKYTAGVIFLYTFFHKSLNKKNVCFLYNDSDGNLEEIYDEEQNLIHLEILNDKELNEFNEIFEKLINIINILFQKNFKVFLNGIGNINNLDKINIYESIFLDNDENENENEYIFSYNKTDYDKYINIITMNNGKETLYYIPNELGYNKNKNNHLTLINELKEFTKIALNKNNIQKIVFAKHDDESFYIYSPIIILINAINLIYNKIIKLRLNNLLTKDKTKFIKSIQEFCLFDIKYLTEYVFKIINNLVILEKYLDDIDIDINIDGLNNTYKEVFESFSTSDNLNDNFKKIMKTFDFFVRQTSMSEEFVSELKSKKYTEIFNSLYDANTNLLDKFKELIKDINEYFSYDQLEKYNELLNEIIKSSSDTSIQPEIKITNTIFNNYQFNLKYPSNYKEYKHTYFKINDRINLYELGKKDFSKINLVLDDFISNKNYKKDFTEKIWKYVNTNNFNIFYLNTKKNKSKSKSKSKSKYEYEYEIEYFIPNVINSTDDSFKDFALEGYKYNLGNYTYDSDQFTFSRGYDILKYDINGELNTIKDILGKDEIKTLCDMKFIKKYSIHDDDSIKENMNKIVSWKIENEFKIKDIDDVEMYIITNNLSELINMLIYMIYEKIKNDKISDVFFKKIDLNMVNLKDDTTIINSIGINLNYDGIDEVSKTNIIETLNFIQVNPEQRQQYLYDNIKSFVKIILYDKINKEIFKIMNEINITNLSIDKITVEKQQIISSETIDGFNNKLIQINNEYENNFRSKKIVEYIKDLASSSILDIQEILNISGNNKILSNQTKIINSKCLNKNKTDELMNIDMNYKVLDLNGNTILIRLIEQYNIYGIKKLIEKNKKVLFTYKNNNMESPLDYLVNSLKNIQSDYLNDDFKYRMQRYSITLENSIKSNNQFDGIEFSNSYDLVSQTITNSVYLFNETMWLKIYLYPSGWTITDKSTLKSMLNIDNEELLINSFDSSDLAKYTECIKSNSESKISIYIKILEDEIVELKNRSKELSMESENKFIINQINYDISGNIDQIDDKIKEKEKTIETYKDFIKKINTESYDSSGEEIFKNINEYKNKLLDMNNLTINWFEYNKLLNMFDNKYLDIIKILNDKCEKNTLISNHLIKIYCSNINEKKHFDLIKKYFKLIYTKVFNDYWDLDRYENSDYNITNKSIIQILKINVIEIIKNELINTLTNYIIQLNKNKLNINNIIKGIKINNDFKKSIKIYLYESMILKLGLNNPDKTNLQINIDEQKIRIINVLEKILEYKFDETEQNELKKIIEFNKFICENLSLNCYEEIIKILYDGKKISIYYEIYDIIWDEINSI